MAKMEFSFAEVGWTNDQAKVRDLINKRDLGTSYKSFTITVAGHAV